MSDDLKPIDPQEEDPKGAKLEEFFEQFQMMAIEQITASRGMDLSKMSPEQIGKILDLVSKGDDQEHARQMVWLERTAEIEKARIQSSTVDQRTKRYALIGIMAVAFIITMAILFFKDQYLQIWLSFLAGLLGGFGLRSASKDVFNTRQGPNPLLKQSEEDKED